MTIVQIAGVLLCVALVPWRAVMTLAREVADTPPEPKISLKQEKRWFVEVDGDRQINGPGTSGFLY